MVVDRGATISAIPPSSSQEGLPSKPTDSSKAKSARQQSATGVQPRGRALAQAIPEHKEVVERSVPWGIAKAWFVPKGQRTKRAYKFGVGQVGTDWKILRVKADATGGYFDTDLVTVLFGIPWSVSEFFAQVLKLDHPFQCDEVDDENATTIFRILTKGPEWAKRKRSSWLTRWESKANELAELLLSSVPDEIASFSKVKRP